MIKKVYLIGFLISYLSIAPNGYAETYSYPGQTLQINTHLQSILGKPEWILIVRDPNSQRVLPYLFDFRQNDNFWVAFTTARSYQITESKLKWGPYAVVNNFCHLENNLITGQSMFITLNGELSPNPNDFRCSVSRYNDMSFPSAPQGK